MLDGYEEMMRAGITRVIGIEVKLRHNHGVTVELGMWIPERELLIPNIRSRREDYLEFPCTVHTLHGDLNYTNQGQVL
jgi:hypothetical protein